MQPGFDGTELPLEDVSDERSKPIDVLCRDPAATRARARMLLPVPCHRCLAFEPETESGCRLLKPPHE